MGDFSGEGCTEYIFVIKFSWIQEFATFLDLQIPMCFPQALRAL